MPFSVIHRNDIVEVRQQLLGDRDVAVVCIFGNTATWTQIHDNWPESCTRYADICINVRDTTLEQTKYSESEFDPNGAHPNDHTGSDESCPIVVNSWVHFTYAAHMRHMTYAAYDICGAHMRDICGICRLGVNNPSQKFTVSQMKCKIVSESRCQNRRKITHMR